MITSAITAPIRHEPRAGRQRETKADVHGVLRVAEERVERTDRKRSHHRAPEAADAAEDEHGKRHEREVEIEEIRRDQAELVHVETAGETRERSAHGETDQALAIHGDARRASRRRILARRAQHAAEPAALVHVGDDDGDDRADCERPASALRDVGERLRGRADLLPVVEDVVGDPEHRERRDARGKPGEPHQR